MPILPVLAASVMTAAEGTESVVATFDLESILNQGIATVQNYIFVTLGVVVPAIVGIMGVVIAVKFGVRWMKKLGQG